MAPTWYLGPLGDLRPLVCPDTDISINTVRYGGVHQALSGARTMDVTGHRKEYNFAFSYLEKSEYEWLQALHLRHVPGPFYLLDPMNANRLTPESSSVKTTHVSTGRGVWPARGITAREWDFPEEAGVGSVCTRWFGRSANFAIRFDYDYKTPVLPGETVTASVWIRSEETGFNCTYTLDWFDRNGDSLGPSPNSTYAADTEWSRITKTDTAPPGAIYAQFALWTPNTLSDLFFAAAQFESGNAATPWQLGGGAPRVLLDQMPTVSPRFPLLSLDLTLLEA